MPAKNKIQTFLIQLKTFLVNKSALQESIYQLILRKENILANSVQKILFLMAVVSPLMAILVNGKVLYKMVHRSQNKLILN